MAPVLTSSEAAELFDHIFIRLESFSWVCGLHIGSIQPRLHISTTYHQYGNTRGSISLCSNVYVPESGGIIISLPYLPVPFQEPGNPTYSISLQLSSACD